MRSTFDKTGDPGIAFRQTFDQRIDVARETSFDRQHGACGVLGPLGEGAQGLVCSGGDGIHKRIVLAAYPAAAFAGGRHEALCAFPSCRCNFCGGGTAGLAVLFDHRPCLFLDETGQFGRATCQHRVEVAGTAVEGGANRITACGQRLVHRFHSGLQFGRRLGKDTLQ